MLYDDTTASQTFELYGPKEYSMAEIAELVDREIFKKRRHWNVPKAILKPVADVLNKVLYWHTISPSEVDKEFIDQTIDRSAKTYADLGIEPGDISAFTYHYLVSCTFTTCMSWKLTPPTARIPRLGSIRSPSRHGEGEEGRQEVLSRS
jgi:NADH dehydrogenase (ubiquinone) 1 alpha subcomplex subunit 9